MSKELEILETLKDMLIGNGCNSTINDYVDSLILPLKQALIELEQLREFDRFCSMGKSIQYCKNEVIK